MANTKQNNNNKNKQKSTTSVKGTNTTKRTQPAKTTTKKVNATKGAKTTKAKTVTSSKKKTTNSSKPKTTKTKVNTNKKATPKSTNKVVKKENIVVGEKTVETKNIKVKEIEETKTIKATEVPNKEADTKNEYIKLELEENIDKRPKRNFFKNSFFCNLVVLTIICFSNEIIFRVLSNYKIIDYATIRIFISTLILSFVFVFLSSLTKKKWLRNIILLFYALLHTIYTWLQLGFLNFLGVYISFNTSSQFGAVTDYIFDFLASFKLEYYLVFIPIVIFIIYLIMIHKKDCQKLKFNKVNLLLIPTFILLCGIYYLTLTIPFMQNKLQIEDNKTLFKNPDVPTLAVNQFGPIVFGALDLKTFLFPTNDSEAVFKFNGGQNTVSSREVPKALEEIAKNEKNKTYANLNNYFLSQKVTDYNDYTGMFEGKNVIVILMESVGEAIINEKYFPNFTKLYNEGWHWENNYSPRNSCATGNNEFSAMTSLYSIYNSCTSNVYRKNTYFEAIFNLFNNKGYTTTSMHDFQEWYYYRRTIHPNMGSGKYYDASNLKIKTAGYYGEWPSDIEFFEKAMDIVLNDESDKPFMTWLTTVTSHQPYSTSSTYGDLYLDYFKGEGYSTSTSRYLSKLKVVDEAIKTLINRLTEAGELDNTVIVLLADHYPYGLNKTQVAEMIKHDLKDYEIERTPFVIYNPSMTPKSFTEYNSYINLVPTLANLMGLEYDPRLYMGTDLLSDDYESRVVFADGSWKNEIAYYNASTSKITYYGDKIYTDEEIQKINSEISLKISMSSTAIKNNYFNYLNQKIEEYNAKNVEDLPQS